MKRFAAVLVLVLALAVVTVPSSDAAESSSDPLVAYPDADYVIIEGSKSGVDVIKRLDGTDKNGKILRSTIHLDSGDSHTVVKWSDVTDSVKIVMVSGDLGDLNLLRIDTIVSPEAPVDLHFEMLSGSLDTFHAISVHTSIAQKLPDSNFTAYRPIDKMTIRIAGEVREVCPTTDLVEIGSMDLRVLPGAEIDRLYPTGEKGRYYSANLSIIGGVVGYVSNIASVVNYMEYHLDSGSVDYMCLGADTEGGSGYYRSNMWTFYVQGDVNIYAGPLMNIGTMILGAGIMDAPSVLSNGEASDVKIARNVYLDMDGHDVDASTCFLTKDGRALRFSNYTIDGTPSSGTVRTSYYVSYQTLPLYGEGGIWPMYDGLTVPGGCNLYLGADLEVRSGGLLMVFAGGKMVNTGWLALMGDMIIEGNLQNGSIIEKRDGGTITGDVGGDGLVAYCIYARPNDGRVELMSVEDNTVVMRSTSGDIYFNSASIRFNSISSKVTVSAPESMYVKGTEFVISLEQESDGWTLMLTGFESFDSLNIEVTVPARIPSGYTCQVLDSDNQKLESDHTYTDVTFIAPGNGKYQVEVYEVLGIYGLSSMMKNIIIAIAIVVVATVTVYFLLKKD